MNNELLICDLDGTLIDSYHGIAEALAQSCDRAGIEPTGPLDRSIVGPPLDQILRSITGLHDERQLCHLRELFVAEYDQRTCTLSCPYAGVIGMLQGLQSHRVPLALATNKRVAPTTTILAHFAWAGFFKRVEAVDSVAGLMRHKSDMLVSIAHVLGVSKTSVVYLGDTAADAEQAAKAGVRFIHAAWGCPDLSVDGAFLVAESPRDVIAHFSQNKGVTP